MVQILPIIIVVCILFAFFGALVYILFFKKKNIIFIDIYKEGSAGHPFVDERDKIIEKPSVHSIQGKKTTKINWILKRLKSFVREPNPRGIDKIKNKKFSKYLYRNGVYVQLEDNLLTTKADDGKQVVHCDCLSEQQQEFYNIKKVNDQWYVKVDGDSYLQLKDKLHPSIIELKAIDDDVRSQTADYIVNAEEQYQSKAGWFERHQLLVSIAVIVIGLIIVASMGFDFISKNLQDNQDITRTNQALAVKLVEQASGGNTGIKTNAPENKPTTNKV